MSGGQKILGYGIMIVNQDEHDNHTTKRFGEPNLSTVRDALR
ncbi:MAG: hypothetical protein RLZZ175_1105 [Bacteroidota bacterium]|jgi:ribosomal protein L28